MFDFSNIEESKKSDVQYLKHGTHKVKVSEIELKKISKGTESWEVGEITISNENGKSNFTIFPFKVQGNQHKYSKGAIVGTMTPEEEQTRYLTRIKHFFTKALGEENFAKATAKVKDFPQLIKNLKNACEKVGEEFYVILVDVKGYAKVPFDKWAGGFASKENDLNYDEVKHGKKSAPANTEAPAQATANPLDDVFAQFNTPGTPGQEDSDDLPF